MKNKNKWKVSYSGILAIHWKWNVVLSLLLLVMDAVLLTKNRKSALIALAFTAVYYLAILIVYFVLKPRIMRELVTFATRYQTVQHEILQEFEMPTALLDPEGHILWMNDNMCDLTEKRSDYKKNISTLFPRIDRASLPVTGWEQDVEFDYRDMHMRAHVQRITLRDLIGISDLIDNQDGSQYLYMVYLFDETELTRLRQENVDQKPVAALIYADNYEEVMERTDEVHQSLLSVLVERKISKYFGAVDGLIKKLEKDKFIAVMNRKSLQELKDDRFALLDGVKTINIGNDIDMTISIGIGAGGKTFSDNYELARAAMDMALGRGGDQAVVRDGEETQFYGGKTQRNEKNTRVKARVKAQALRELITAGDEVVVMGHANPDMDSLGASIGIVRAAMTVGKKVHIVLGEQNTNISGWVKRFRESKDYDEDLFITHEQAMQSVTNSTVVVVVDTNRPSMTECREILTLTRSIVVLDHHRQTTETIEKASLSYIEPSASSACEMVAEILQYFEESVKLRNLEADSIYAGMVIDTNNFVAKTGVRTFEAAAYLRRRGADVTRVRKALRENMDSYKAKAEAVRSAETFEKVYALSICQGEGLESPSAVGAQAANDLLNIEGVKASFVVTPIKDKCFISARSIDEVNVQLVCERLGGGGHLNIAGAQLNGVTPQEALEKIKETLTTMTEEGAI